MYDDSEFSEEEFSEEKLKLIPPILKVKSYPFLPIPLFPLVSEQCKYIYTRGTKKGNPCLGKVIRDGYCKSCLNNNRKS